MIFRKEVARLSKEVNNVQTKQCDNEWKDIEPDKLTITTLFKNKFAFTKFDNFLYSSISKDADRIETSFNFKDYFFNNGEPTKFENHKSTHLPVGFFVKQGMILLSKKYTDAVCSQIEFLNKCWKKMFWVNLNEHLELLICCLLLIFQKKSLVMHVIIQLGWVF